jgi:hypothetical protein
MPNTYQIGRVGSVYAAKETTFGTAPTFAATDAIRHLMVKLGYNPRNRVNSPERLAHPSQVTRFTRRTTADWAFNGIFYPSGTLATLPDQTDFYECGLGAVQNPTPLSTTVASVPTTTGATLGSGTGLAVGQAVLINVTTGSPATGRVVRFLTSVAGAVVTWAPALPQAPNVGDTVKSCVTYNLATALPNALRIGHYLTSVNYEGSGCVVDQLKFTLDANDEVRWEASGPMIERIRPAQSKPGAFTVVGSTPPSGLTGGMRVGAAAYEFLKAEFTITNAMELDNVAYGTAKAQAFYRKGKRSVEVAVNSMYSSDLTLLTAAEGTTDQAILAQTGQTEGSIIAMYCPLVEFEVPDDPDADETMELDYKGVAKGSAGNDEFYLAVA